MTTQFMLVSSLFLTFLSAILWRRATHSTLGSAIITLSLLLSLLASGLFILADSLSGAGIDESVLFHLRADLGGAGLSEFKTTIIFSSLYVAATFLFAYYVFISSRNGTDKKKPNLRVALAIIALVGSFSVNPGVRDIASLASSYSSSADAVKSGLSHLVPPPKDFFLIDNGAIDLNNKNLVYIYLESIERTYLDEEIFPGLMPNLKAIEARSLSFTNIHQTVASNWTIAGMVNSQCGIPLLIPGGQGNSMSGAGRFLPKANCVGDVLNDKGYQLHYLGGSNKNFAGKATFYRNHGFQRVEGVWDFSEKIQPSKNMPAKFVTKGLYRSAWGLYDDTLFEEVKTRFSELSEQSQPFALFALTLDTHAPNGHVSRYCSDVAYRDGANPMLNAVHCADKLISRLYQFLTEHPNFENTILVIASDHLAMPNSARDLLERGDRKNLFLVTGRQIATAAIETRAAPLDIAPTILNLLGADIKGLGFGRDLFSPDNLMGRFNTEVKFNHEILQHRQFLYDLWDFPQLVDGFTIDVSDETLSISGDVLKFPALILVGDDLTVQSVRFSFWTKKPLEDHFRHQDPDQRYVWIDYCANFPALREAQALKKDPLFCLVIGQLVEGEIDKTRANFFSLVRNTTLTREQVSDIFRGFDGMTQADQTVKDKSLSPAQKPSSLLGSETEDNGRLPRVARLGGKSRLVGDANSLELIDRNKNDYRQFEISLSWTSDNQLVCLRAWADVPAFFGVDSAEKITEAEFQDLVNTSPFTQCTLSSLANWLRQNPDHRMVTIVREEPVKAFELIAKKFPDLQNRFIPAVKTPAAFVDVEQLSYEDIIWNIFGSEDELSISAIAAQLPDMKPYAILMPRSRAEQGLARVALQVADIPSYVATINSSSEVEKYMSLGVTEVFTDAPPVSSD